MTKENWKSTKEVAESLGISTKTIINFRNDNKRLFEGLVKHSSEESFSGRGNTLLWHLEAIKNLAFNIKNTQMEKWKRDIFKEFEKKGG